MTFDADKLRALVGNLRSVRRPSTVILLNPHGKDADKARAVHRALRSGEREGA